MFLLCSKPSLGSQLSQSKSPILTMTPRSYVTHLFSHPITPPSCLLASPLTDSSLATLASLQLLIHQTLPQDPCTCRGQCSTTWNTPFKCCLVRSFISFMSLLRCHFFSEACPVHLFNTMTCLSYTQTTCLSLFLPWPL